MFPLSGMICEKKKYRATKARLPWEQIHIVGLIDMANFISCTKIHLEAMVKHNIEMNVENVKKQESSYNKASAAEEF